MATPSRIRRKIDVNRLRETLAAPGIDTRTWIFFARVDDDDEAIRWDDELGWLVDVTATGGELDGEGPIPCRVASPLGEDGGGFFCPVRRTQPVIVMLTGDPNAGTCVIVGSLFAISDAVVPTSIVGETIDEALAKATIMLKTGHDYIAEVGDRWRVKASDTATLEAPNVKLADADADQAFVRGNARASADHDFTSAFGTWIEAVRVAIATAGGTLDNTAMTLAIEQYDSAIDNALSTKIHGT